MIVPVVFMKSKPGRPVCFSMIDLLIDSLLGLQNWEQSFMVVEEWGRLHPFQEAVISRTSDAHPVKYLHIRSSY